MNSEFTIQNSQFLMPVSPARQVAYEILRGVESGRAFAVDLLQRPRVRQLIELDRRLATELVMGVLRWRGELDFRIEQLSGKPLKRFDPEVAAILRLGVYQLRFLEKVPKAAIVNEAVEMTKGVRKRSAAGLVNAVLRKCTPPAQRLASLPFEELNSESRESLSRAVPAWLLARWAGRDWTRDGAAPRPDASGPIPRARDREAGTETALRLAWATTRVPPTTLRIACLRRQASARADVEAFRREFAEAGIRTRPTRYAPRALVVESGNVGASKPLSEGRVVIQDEASQLVAELVAPSAPMHRGEAGQRVLDLCAAPGIKTCQLAEALGGGMLVACDLSPSRLRTFRKLLLRRVPSEVQLHVVRLDATERLPFTASFDRILLDVPCSGTGTLARNPEIKWRLQPGDVDRLAQAQLRMLKSALEILAPRGRLVYATCSLEPEENEQVVESVLEEARYCRLLTQPELSREFPAFGSLFDSRGYFRTRPDLHEMDGFFAAVIVREP
jgi:16S rRNA (cytosine967-C5)-methyltransferase